MDRPPMAAGPRVFAVFAVGYFLSYLVRGVNLPLAASLRESLNLSSSDLGLLTSLYLLAFALCQLPLGLLLDRFGPRRVQMALLTLAACGAALSAAADSLWALAVGRLLLGVGTSGCLMAGLKAIIVWFAPQRLTVLNGAIYAIGGLGAVVTGAPIDALLGVIGWRGVLTMVALLILLTVGLLWRQVPTRDPLAAPAGDTGLRASLTGIASVARSRQFWRIAPIAMASQGAYLALQGLWAGPYLRDVDGLDASSAAAIVTLIGWAMVVGAASSGWLARQLEQRGISLQWSAGTGMALFVLVQGAIVADLPVSGAVAWALFGLCGTTGIITYAQVSRAFPLELSGRANTTLNLLVFGLAFVFQYGFGLVLEALPHEAGGYSPMAYRVAWGAIIVTQVLGLVWYARAPRQADTVVTRPLGPSRTFSR